MNEWMNHLRQRCRMWLEVYECKIRKFVVIIGGHVPTRVSVLFNSYLFVSSFK